MKISARNQLKGKVVSIENGSVNAIVHIDIGGGNVLSSTVSLAAVKELITLHPTISTHVVLLEILRFQQTLQS